MIPSLNNPVKKPTQPEQKKAETLEVCLLTVLKKPDIYLKFFFKFKNAESTAIAIMVETSLKYLINSAIYVGVLQLFDFLDIFYLLQYNLSN